MAGKTLKLVKGKSPTDLTVHKVSMLGSNNGNIAFVQGVAVGLGSLPCSFIQYLGQRKVYQQKFAFNFFQVSLERK